jgi:hypothetical protein
VSWGRGFLAILCVLFFAVSSAGADDSTTDSWLPHPDDATWTYSWTDSFYSKTPTKEQVTVKENTGSAFTLAWTTEDLDNPPTATSSTGTVSFQETGGGLINTDWSSNSPPPAFPILCAALTRCGNSLASVYYNIIWGGRVPVLAAPLLEGAEWSSTGGAANDVASNSEYMGTEDVTVPAFDKPVKAAVVQSDISQAGALGDPYGSGVRTVWWVYGVGPVKVVFEHSGGGLAPVTTAELQSTSLTAKAPPPDANYFPLQKGLKARYSWTNTKWLKKPSVQDFVVDQVVNSSARVSVKTVSGPIKVAGAYGFTLRSDGVTNIWGTTSTASLVKLPPLGPKRLPVAKRRHFFTPFDLMTYGFNPLFTAYPTSADSWEGKVSGRDYKVYGVTGTAKVLGIQKVKVPAGTFDALVVRTTLTQPGYPWGSGVRTSWFAAGRGLVKLVFAHGDHSTSRVELLK